MAEQTSTCEECAESIAPLRPSAWSRLSSLLSSGRRSRTWDGLTPEQQADAANHVFRGNL